MLKRLLLIAIALLLALPALAQPQHSPGTEAMAAFIAEARAADWLQIAPADALDFIDTIAPFVLDVRNPDEFAAGHVEGAVLIPLGELDARIAELPQDLDTPMLVYCKVGIRGNFGLAYLKMLGFTNVRNIRGGIDAWTAAGLPVVTP